MSVLGLMDRCTRLPCPEATTEELAAVHTKAHIERIDGSAFYLDSDTPIELDEDLYESKGTARAARLAAGGVTSAAQRLARGEVANAFALVRPPGHHCSSTVPSGFCYYNNVAVAAHTVLREVEGVRRVMILDWDVHHGNGTESIFFGNPNVLYVSLHQHYYGKGHVLHKPKLPEGANVFRHRRPKPEKEDFEPEAVTNAEDRIEALEDTATSEDDDDDSSSSEASSNEDESRVFYPGTGVMERVGEGPGKGRTVNLPWPCLGFGDVEYLMVLNEVVVPMAREFAPDLVIISSGFDCITGDALGSIHVTPTGIFKMTQTVLQQITSRVVVAMEGGYNLRNVAMGAEMVMRALLEATQGSAAAGESSTALYHQTKQLIEKVKKTHAPYWKCFTTSAANGDGSSAASAAHV
jgi:acetoin utilization deacetylase AcuC-like enzyme